MGKGRLEAFSDGVFAIIITIMVLELKVPHGDTWADLMKLWPVFLSYILSFTFVGVYWNNHHHMLHAVKKVSAGILWGNLHLLFWLSLLPFTTGWMGENHFTSLPVAVYGFDLLMSGLAYVVLQAQIIKFHGNDSVLARAIGNDTKGKLSFFTYLISIPIALAGYPYIAVGLMFSIVILWIIPDRRIEKVLES
jgi:uncharacterized membrane protein